MNIPNDSNESYFDCVSVHRILFEIRFLITLIFIVFTLGLFSPASAQNSASSYGITDLGTLTGIKDTDSQATAINASGTVVGRSGLRGPDRAGIYHFDSSHAFLWQPSSPNATTGTMTDLEGLSGYFCGASSRYDTSANSINRSNQVVGYSWTGPADCSKANLSSANYHAALFSGGFVTDLGTQLDLALYSYDDSNNLLSSYATGINDKGWMVGWDSGPDNSLGMWFFDTTYHNLGNLGGLPPHYDFCSPSGLNNKGQVIGNCLDYTNFIANGTHSFLYNIFNGSGPLDIGTLGGGYSSANALNDSGVVVGGATISTGEAHAFRSESGTLVDLGTLLPDVSNWSTATAINSFNDVVGFSDTEVVAPFVLNADSSGYVIIVPVTPQTGHVPHAVLWRRGQKVTLDLNKLLDKSLGWELTSATGINDLGQIVGSGMLNGQLHAFLLTPCGSSGGDTDGDKLCDDWEKFGVNVPDNTGTNTVGFLNLPAMGANPNHKDIFVQTDYMVAGDHSHKPKSGVIDKVIAAFANAPVTNPDKKDGITLHVDCGPDCIMDPVSGAKWGGFSQAKSLIHSDTIISTAIDTKEDDWTDFNQIKDQNFPPERKLAFHYAIFAHSLGTLDENGMLSTNSGLTKATPSSDFVVTLGGSIDSIGTQMEQAGTFMHELGHNLGLRHGGFEDDNYKPNYLSVMNYFFQFGLLTNGAHEMLDYSRFVLPDLDETKLDEFIGLNGDSSVDNYGTNYYCPGQHADDGDKASVNNVNGPIDWDCNSDRGTGSAVQANINGDLDSKKVDNFSTLSSYNDWIHLVFDGGAIADLGEKLPLPVKTPHQHEITPAINATIPRPFDTAISCPGITPVIPGTSLNENFTIINRGLQADTYNLTSTATDTWWDLSGLPITVTLAPGASRQLMTPANIPNTVSAGTGGHLLIEATSQLHPLIQDNCDAMIKVVSGTGLITAPNVIGQTKAEATVVITGAGLALGTLTTQSSATVSADSIISQTPIAGSAVALGSTVSLIVSSGPVPISVPSVVDQTQTSASLTLSGLNLTIGTVTFQSSTTVVAGSVISQSPSPGTLVLPSSAVSLVVSSGPSVLVPNLIGDPQATAITTLTSIGLTLGTLTSEPSATVAKGNVISQDPAASSLVSQKAAVNLIISSGPANVTIPNVVGLAETDAVTILTNAGLILATVNGQISTTIAKGNVISQNPVAGTLVTNSSTVSLIISDGPGISVPNVIGKGLSLAIQAINGTGFTGLTFGTFTAQYSSTVPKDLVIAQDPAASTLVAPGTIVNLVASLGPAPLAVPNVVGQTQATATTSIKGAGFVLGSVTFESSATTAAGTVLSQDPAANAPIPLGLVINLIVSSGSSVSVPNVVSQTQSSATSTLSGAGLVVGTVNTEASQTVATGNVISQAPPAGISVERGSTVNLIVSSGSTWLVPNLVGQTSISAIDTVDGAGLVVGTVSNLSSATVPSGTVLSQDPLSGTSVTSGTSVNWVVSSGSTPVLVPYLVGQTRNSALLATLGAGLTDGSLSSIYSTTVPFNNILSQDPTPFTSVAIGSLLNTIESKGIPILPVPNVNNETRKLATSALTEAGLVIGTVTIESSTTVDSGNIISQDPAAYSSATLGSAVNLIVSAGSASVPNLPVPNLIGQTQAAAAAAISNAGFTLGKVSARYFSGVAADVVAIETPPFGSSLTLGSSMDLQVSSGPPQPLPNVVGQMQIPAATSITDAGYFLGTATTQFSSTMAVAGQVISQDPPAGAPFGSFSRVNLVVSLGPPLLPVPNVVGDTQEAATNALTSAGFIVGTVATQASANVAAGLVISQGPTDAAMVAQGSTVNLIVASGQTPVSAIIDTVAGNGQPSQNITFNNDGKPAIQVPLSTAGLAVGLDRTLYISDTVNVYRVGHDGLIHLVVPGGTYNGDGIPASRAYVENPQGLAMGNDGSLYIAEGGNDISLGGRIRRIDPSGVITTVAGNGKADGRGEGGPAINASLYAPSKIAVGPDGSLYISEGSTLVRGILRVDPSGILSRFVGNPVRFDYNVGAIAVSGRGDVYFSSNTSEIFRVSAGTTLVERISGPGNGSSIGDGGLATSANVNPVGLAVGPDGSIFIGDGFNGRIRRINPAGIITTVAGKGFSSCPGSTPCFGGDGGPATAAEVGEAGAVTLGPDGTLFLSDISNRRVRRVIGLSPGSILVPNVVGQTQEAAKNTIAASLTVGNVTSQSSTTVPAGDVISQTPSAGMSVRLGALVNLVIASGSNNLIVPNVVGQSEVAATNTLIGKGLVLGIVTSQPSATVASGNVISQAPAAGASVSPNSVVNLVVSSGSTTVLVPNVVGTTAIAASTAISGVGLVVGKVTTQGSSTIPKDSIISQIPAAGTSAALKSAVSLVVSSGPTPIMVPNLVGTTQASSLTALNSVGLVLGTVSTQSSTTVPKETIILQNPAAGSFVASGSAVNVIVSSGALPVLVPNVVASSPTAASAIISGVGLVIGTITTQTSSTIPKDTIISQSPVAGTSVVSNSAVNLVVSSGPATVLVPNVVGEIQAVATVSLNNVGLNLGTITPQASTSVPSGVIISQNPSAGTSVSSGSAVNLVVSSGPEPILVPDLVGATQGAAATSLTGVGLVLGTVTTQASSTIVKDTVISQDPAAGTSVSPNSAVSLVVSSGPTLILVPNVIGQTQASATMSVTSVNLVLGTVTTQTSSTITAGEVISQTPIAGTAVAPSTAVNLIVSSGSELIQVPNIVGEMQTAATTTLTAVGLTLGTVSTESSSTFAKDTVISQDPVAGTSVALASKVNLIISSGSSILLTPPVANAGRDQTVECAGLYGTNAMLDGSASFSSDGSPLTFTWSGAFGTANGPTPKVNLPMGINLITLMVTDRVGGIATSTVVVKVVDTTPPLIKAIIPTTNFLWPPDHRMVPVTFDISSTDICSATTICKVLSIRSNEPVNDKGNGDKAPDWEIIRNFSINLRAERIGPRNKRDYTVTVQCMDSSGNSATKTVVVSVQHDKEAEEPLDRR